MNFVFFGQDQLDPGVDLYIGEPIYQPGDPSHYTRSRQKREWANLQPEEVRKAIKEKELKRQEEKAIRKLGRQLAEARGEEPDPKFRKKEATPRRKEVKKEV